VTSNEIAELFPAEISGEWIVVASAADLQPGTTLIVRIAERNLRLQRSMDGHLSAQLSAASDRPEPRIHLQTAYSFIWFCFGAPNKPLFLLPEYAQTDGRIVECGSFGVRTSPLRAVENFLDMGHFPYVHTDILGAEPRTEVNAYRIELRETVDELWAIDCRFHQPKAAAGAATAQETDYTYRVVSPFNVILYKSPPAPHTGNDVICLFIQPLAEQQLRAHLLMVLKDDTSTMSGMIAFQQLIFGQDKPILENHIPLLLPLIGQSEKPARADAMSMAYRRWLLAKNWTYGTQRFAQNSKAA